MGPKLNEFRPDNSGRRPGIGLRLVVMAFIVLVLWIAAMAVDSQVSDRERSKNDAEAEIAKSWGAEQLVAGPAAILPWVRTEVVERTDSKGAKTREIVRTRHTAVWLPQDLSVTAELQPELRSRGIFQTVVYVGRVKLKGVLRGPDLRAMDVDASGALWDKAQLSVAVDDVKGIRSASAIKLGKLSLATLPGPGPESPWATGVHADAPSLPRHPGEAVPFELDLELNGSKVLWIVPSARLSEAAVSSTWPDPAFSGAYLPLSREITPQGFKASWKVPELARSFPSAWVDSNAAIGDIRLSALGVGLVKTVSTYQQASRATKYAILFILLTFTAFFLFEVFNRLRVHPIQYLLVGAALVVFYLLLLSLSEHLGFDGAYALATVMTLIPISVYVRGVLRESSRIRVLLGLLLGLYAYLYIILRLNDYALLMGSLAIFAALSTAMVLTRNVDWSRLEPAEER